MPRAKKPDLKRRKDGRFRLKYQGQEFYSAVNGDPEECFAQKEEYIRRQLLRETEEVNGPTLAAYALEWLPRAKPTVAASTYAESAILLEKLVNACGEKKIKDVLPSDIKSVYSVYFLGLSDSYIRGAKQLYCALFDAAMSDRLIDRNPAREKSAAPHKGTKGGHRAITAQEREWIHTYCTDHRCFPAVMAMLYEGLRPPEAKALDLSAVDREAGVLRLQQFAHKKGHNHYEITSTGKNDRAARTIPLFAPFLAAIGERKSGPLVSAADGGELTVTAWKMLWASYVSKMEQAINGMPKRWHGCTKEHKKIKAEAERLRRAGDDAAADAKLKEIPPWIPFTVRPYDLRHSFATMCRDNGIELNTVRAWMGHADATMILKIYDEVSDSRSASEAERLNAVFGVKRGSNEK